MSADNAAASAEERILAELARIVVDIVGDEYALDLDIGMDTSLGDDLELESIEFVALATQLQDRFGDRVDFEAFVAGKEIGEMVALTVGDVVSYVARCRSDG